MRWIAIFCASVVWLGLGVPLPAQAEDVDVALVMVSDVSRSIDDSEYKLEKDGYANAFANPQVISAIRGGPNGQIAVAYLEFAGNLEVHTVIDWTVIKDQGGADAFIRRLRAAPRSFSGRTSISAGIDRALELFAESAPTASRRVIDVCGDGTNNAGRDVSLARDDALKAGVTINGLAIINDHPVSWTYAHVQPPGGLPNYYRENVTGGPGSFVLEVHDFHTFGEAMTRKLIQEIASGRKAAETVMAR
ncbi:MAG TPA: DUF1194 domain-containing protein [Rhodopila sp.]|uniref:DUF1194 domain-containing protein n=1 Tax=Rhodopila sp. TaxID=2480087 RepID=UPI002BAA5EF8|nr:DUF1194 domain-containing protein [Rhodopila sp.]HVY16149.1 DUF1194 domain-containing protein [Rhodopila sp.]